MDNKKLMIIDGSSLLHRAFYALPLLTTKEGVYTNGVYGFLTMFYKIKEEYDPGYICVAFDKKGPTFRHKEYKEYKESYEDFYKASTAKYCDLFLCLENGNLYIPDKKELFRYTGTHNNLKTIYKNNSSRDER